MCARWLLYICNIDDQICLLFLLYHFNTEAVLFACLSSGWATTTGRLLGPKVRNSIKCLSRGHSDVLSDRKSNLGFATYRLLARRSTNCAEPRRCLLLFNTNWQTWLGPMGVGSGVRGPWKLFLDFHTWYRYSRYRLNSAIFGIFSLPLPEEA